jgi:predicted RecA/RadA family phage recombinase
MKNFVQQGETLTVVAPYAVSAGQGVLVGSLFGIAVNDALIGASVEIRTEGVYEVAKTSALAISQGDVLYWDDVLKVVSKTSTGIPVGMATAPAANPSAIVRMTLIPNFVVEASSDTGTQVAAVAEGNVIGGIPLLFMIPITAGPLADTDTVMTHKVRVLDAHLILRGSGVAATTLQVKNGATAITDAMAASGADSALVRCASIDDNQYDIAAGGTLRVTSATGATQPDALVVVTAVRVV